MSPIGSEKSPVRGDVATPDGPVNHAAKNRGVSHNDAASSSNAGKWVAGDGRVLECMEGKTRRLTCPGTDCGLCNTRTGHSKFYGICSNTWARTGLEYAT